MIYLKIILAPINGISTFTKFFLKNKKRISKVLIGIAFTLMPFHQAAAHKVILFAWVEDGMIFTESSFGSDRKAKNCSIQVFNEKGVMVHAGKTNQQGEYRFEIPENIDSDLLLKLDAGTGHQARWKIPKTELTAAPSAKEVTEAHKQSEKLKKSPSVFRILTGIAIIFLMALTLKFLKRNKS